MKQTTYVQRFQYAKKEFERRGHKATLVQNTDRICAIDWGAADGSIEYYVTYLIDKEQGNLYVSGDLGSCVASWLNPNSVHNIACYVRDAGYFIEKMQCTTNKFRYVDEDVLAAIKEDLREWGVHNTKDFRKDWKAFVEEAPGCIDSREGLCPNDYVEGFLEEYFGSDFWELVSGWGRSVDQRVFLWAAGLNMAVSQLEEEGLLGAEE